ncbi:MAG: hypothetical protein IKP00_07100 [Victivallales bacterium]|nr:hypothetical protein [Victivallales bacterium]
MALFDTNEFDPKFHDATTTEEPEQVRWSVKENTMKEAIGDLEQGKTTHYVTCASWSMPELLNYVLRHHNLKNSEVDCFTWNLGMSAVRTFMKLEEEGYIKRFRLLAHSTMQRFVADALAVLEQHAETIVLYPNHAKGFLIHSGETYVTCTASANFNHNPQIEAGCITMDKGVYEMHHKWLNLLFEKRELLANQYIEPAKEKQEPPSPEYTLYIIRGLAGAGKSTLARSIADVAYSENDFLDETEKKNIRLECWNSVKTAMESGVRKIAVANPFSEEKEIRVYQELAQKYQYMCHIVTVENRHDGKPTHEADDRKIEEMRKKFKVVL